MARSTATPTELENRLTICDNSYRAFEQHDFIRDLLDALNELEIIINKKLIPKEFTNFSVIELNQLSDGEYRPIPPHVNVILLLDSVIEGLNLYLRSYQNRLDHPLAREHSRAFALLKQVADIGFSKAIYFLIRNHVVLLKNKEEEHYTASYIKKYGIIGYNHCMPYNSLYSLATFFSGEDNGAASKWFRMTAYAIDRDKKFPLREDIPENKSKELVFIQDCFNELLLLNSKEKRASATQDTILLNTVATLPLMIMDDKVFKNKSQWLSYINLKMDPQQKTTPLDQKELLSFDNHPYASLYIRIIQEFNLLAKKNPAAVLAFLQAFNSEFPPAEIDHSLFNDFLDYLTPENKKIINDYRAFEEKKRPNLLTEKLLTFTPLPIDLTNIVEDFNDPKAGISEMASRTQEELQKQQDNIIKPLLDFAEGIIKDIDHFTKAKKTKTIMAEIKEQAQIFKKDPTPENLKDLKSKIENIPNPTGLSKFKHGKSKNLRNTWLQQYNKLPNEEFKKQFRRGF